MNKKIRNKVLCLILMGAVSCSSFIGCTTAEKEGSKGGEQKVTEQKQEKKEVSADYDVAKVNKLVDEPITLKYWTSIHPSASKVIKNYSEIAAYKEIESKTGIKIEFLHPAQGQEKEQFQLLIASGEHPDIIEGIQGYYPGGGSKALQDGVVVDLQPIMSEYAPNYERIRNKNDLDRKMTMTDEGTIFAIECIEKKTEEPFWGPMIRTDWLSELGLERPETIDDWYNVLKAFKEEKGATAPLMLGKNGIESSFVGAFGIGPSFYKDAEDKVQYGPMQEGFKTYLETLNKWYQEGLIDAEFPTRDYDMQTTMFTNGSSGAVCDYLFPIDTYMKLAKGSNPTYEIAATQHPSLNKGEPADYGYWPTNVKGVYASVTEACKNQELALQWLDNAYYSEEGSMLMNWGVEGVSYELVEGNPQFTDEVINNPDYPYDLVCWKYKRHVGPYYRDWSAAMPFSDQLKEAGKLWGVAEMTLNLPEGISLTPEESAEFSTIMSDINTYKEIMVVKFITGTEPLSKFDEFTAQIKSLNIDRAIAIQQAAYERFKVR